MGSGKWEAVRFGKWYGITSASPPLCAYRLTPYASRQPLPAQRSGAHMAHFRFQDLEIWQLAKKLAVKFHKVADRLEKRKLYRYAEQLRAAGLSISNNIAEAMVSY